MAVIKASVAFLTAVLLGRYAIKPLFRLFSQSRNEEIFTALALLVILATATATGHAGLSLTLGAFLGGMIISETPYRHLIQTEAKPFRNLLLGFFFITIGMSLDWRLLTAHWGEILLFLVLLITVKASLVAAAARSFGWSTPGSVQLGFLLAQGSEFIFVIVAMPMVRQELGEEMVGVILTGVAASLACTPSLASLGNSLARRLKQNTTNAGATKESMGVATRPVVIFGMDEVGRAVADALEAHGVSYDAFERNYDRFLAASADGYPVALGDPGDIRFMETLSYAEREAVVLTNVHYEVTEDLKPVMQDRYPDLSHFIAVDTEENKTLLEGTGIWPVINRSFPRGIDLAAAVLRHQKIHETKIQGWMQRQQERALQNSISSTSLVAD